LLFFMGLAGAVAAVWLQSTDWLSFFGVKINLLLVLVLVLGLFLKSFWHYAFIALTVVAILKIGPLWNRQSLALLGIFLAAFYFKKYLFGKPILNNTVLIAAGTLLFYLFSDPAFLIQNSLILIQELIYNLIGGWILFLILEKNFNHENFP
jgi:hypothetical protein